MNYIVLYPSLLGGEWFTSSISATVDTLQTVGSRNKDNIVLVNCLTRFAESAQADGGDLLNENYNLNPDLDQIVRDHPSKLVGEVYKPFVLRFNPIVLYTKRADMWWEKRHKTLFSSIRKSDITLEWLQSNIHSNFTQDKLDNLWKQLPEFVIVPDIFTYWHTGEFRATDMNTHKQEQIRHIKKVFSDVQACADAFEQTHYSVNMDNALLGRHELFYKDVKTIFPRVDTDKLGELLDEWRSRQKI